MKNKIYNFQTLKQLKVSKPLWFVLLGMLFLSTSTWSQADVAIRFANPVLDCETNTYCVDVEYQSTTSNQQVFGTNVRFYYVDDVMEFLDFRDFQGGYSILTTPSVLTGNTAFASTLGFNGGEVLDYVNGAIQLTNTGASPIVLPTDGSWAKIFQVCFTINASNINDLSSFCPSLIWDLEQDPSNGSYIINNDGVVITVVDPDPQQDSDPSVESAEQFNWDYVGTGASAPFGAPQSTICVDAVCQIEELPTMSPSRQLLMFSIVLGLVFLGYQRLNPIDR